MFDNYLVTICKIKVTLKLNKLAYVGIYILELSKVLMYEFHYDYIKNKYGYNSRLLFIDTITLLYDIKCHVNEDFSNHSAQSKYDDSNISVICKIKDEIDGVAIEECFGLKPKMYLFLVDE